MSATRVVVVPSLFHSSYPAVGSYALKNTVPPTATRLCGCESPLPGWMSATCVVVAPSLFHSSYPAVGAQLALEESKLCEVLVVGDKDTVRARSLLQDAGIVCPRMLLGNRQDVVALFTKAEHDRSFEALIGQKPHLRPAVRGMISSLPSASRA